MTIRRQCGGVEKRSLGCVGVGIVEYVVELLLLLLVVSINYDDNKVN